MFTKCITGRSGRAFGFLAAALLLTVIGCGGPPTTTVTGTVTLDGTPLPSGSLSFVSDDGRVGTATIKDGHYTMAEAPVGKVKATVTGGKGGDNVMANLAKKKFGGMADKMKEHGVSTEADDKNAKIVKVPAKYGGTEQSGLVYEIKRGGTQTIDIPLQSK